MANGWPGPQVSFVKRYSMEAIISHSWVWCSKAEPRLADYRPEIPVNYSMLLLDAVIVINRNCSNVSDVQKRDDLRTHRTR
jgi:hypothetical protein